MPDFLGGDGSVGETILQWPEELIERVSSSLLAHKASGAPDGDVAGELKTVLLVDGETSGTELSERLGYHLREFARQAADERSLALLLDHAAFGAGSRVLDVGGGAGQTLHLLGRWQPAERICLDIDLPSLAFGLRVAEWRQLPIGFVRASAHEIPFSKGRFTHVICRVGLNYMHQGRALSEMARVLEPGGALYCRAEGPGFDLKLIGRARSPRRLASLILDMAAGVTLGITGWQSTPGRHLGIGRAFASFRTVRRVLDRAGCDVVEAATIAHHRGLPTGFELLARRRSDC